MKKNLGFTLVEMSIVLVLIGLILTGILGAAQSQMEGAKLRETRQALVDIREALTTYTLANGHLPCPADPALANTAAGAGLESRVAASGLCLRLNGVVPWATLGVKELDSWGGRFSYSVKDDYVADSYTSFNAAQLRRFARRLPVTASIGGDFCAAGHAPTVTFGLCSITAPLTAPININTDTVSNVQVAQNVAAVIISHGRNRRGSFNPGGGGRVTGALGDEAQNALPSTAVAGALASFFISHPFVHDPDQLAAIYYDDLTEWIPINALVGKMVSIGRLP